MHATCDDASALVKSARLLAWFSKALEDASAQSGLSLAKYRVLLALESGPLRAAELASRLRVRASTLTGLVAALERRGLVARTPSRGDRRGVWLSLTPAGDEAFRRAELGIALELEALERRYLFEATAARLRRNVAAAHDQILGRRARPALAGQARDTSLRSGMS